MMKIKYFFFALFAFISINLLGQDINECGKDNNPFLTESEAKFLKEYIKSKIGVKHFDFKGKKILFVTGSAGTTLGTKTDYFDSVKKYGDTSIPTGLIALNEEEKLEYEYDAIVWYWSKILPPKINVLKKAKKENNKEK